MCLDQRYGCKCLRLLTCAQMLMHAITHGGCTDTARESALKVDSSRMEREEKGVSRERGGGCRERERGGDGERRERGGERERER